ncbi:aminoglycoside phosphotransferase family protein [Jiangella ureilytica]|uniref:aminoglycoside phosphotransferase family protein n=1 Tax=Jiangella ureilytica TaxID=2530374 RepID=UPI0013A5D221|nr:aminoglycoside phosphotransferase family protein [Jiangella ureilytica]
MTAFRLPALLARAADRGLEPGLTTWAADTLPSMVPALVERWGLTMGAPYEPGGQCSWVAPGTTPSGDAVVLKVTWRHPEAEHEADGLRFWNGDGVVRLHDEVATDDTRALLLERCTPGTWLKDSMPPQDQDVMLAGMLRRLWRRPPDGHPFPSLASMCDHWARDYESRADAVADRRGWDRGLLSEGVALYRELPRTSDDDVLLCTDLHPENVLAAQREPWLVVDPKPHVGDRTYDATQHMFNMDRLHTDPGALSDRMAALLDLDPERLRLWLFARCVQEAPEWDGMYEVAAQLAPWVRSRSA